ncbi:DUF2897 domain-containing protein [Halopseudomonas sp.]|jgi:uncharacterized membrane protein YukC|uniref:DUF2897 domain-containing protein n=1 Tax=Halopseudomonas sp. TaxID=2901191 RepID=UPI001A495F5D|nr:DUF2897 family protein [Pseudomonas sp.]|tara:strand:- start:2444 stop:2620 length:177 start_codon:yes stop_codon:yes gene_type:complete
MPLIGWIFIGLAVITVLGALYKVYITAYKMPISEEKMRLIKARQAELEKQERQEIDRD